jgi:hypothetical protein
MLGLLSIRVIKAGWDRQGGAFIGDPAGHGNRLGSVEFVTHFLPGFPVEEFFEGHWLGNS